METKTKPQVDHTPAELDMVSKVLLRAAALIEQYGHCQQEPGIGRDGSICVMVAINKADVEINPYGRVFADAAWRLEKNLPPMQGKNGNRRAATWSDETSTAEVLAKLRAVALAGTLQPE